MVKKEGPDQARSWAIAIAAFIINVLLSGISRANGLFYVSLIENLKVTRLQANLPFTFRNVVRNLAGPLVGIIGQRYGSRDVTIIGGIFASVGISFCYFAPDIFWVSILWGGVHGLGVAFGNTLFQVVINYYFVKYRASATGLAFSGGCVGSFIFPALLEYMLKNIGLKGTFLLTGGFILNVLPAALLMKEPPWALKPKELKDINGQQKKKQDLVNDIGISKNSINVVKVEISTCKTNKIVSRHQNTLDKRGEDNPSFNDSELKLHDQAACKRSASCDTEGSYLPPEDSICKGLTKLFCDPMFYVISLSLAVFTILFDPSITIMIDYTKDKGLGENTGTYFIMTMSLADFCGRLCFGWLTDGNYLSMAKFMSLLHIVQGICFLLMPLFSVFEVLMAVLILYGIAEGAMVIMYSVLVAKYLSSIQSLAIGCISFISGIIGLAVPPVIGYFRDNIGSYDGMFYISGAFSVLTGAIWILEPLLVKLNDKRTKNSNINSCN